VVFGPPIHNILPLAKASESVKYFYDFINGSYKEIPDTGFWAIADVRDVAAAHLLALENQGVSNKRVLIARGNWSYQQVADILHERFPELKDRVPRGTPGQAWPAGGVYGVDNSLSTEVLGLKYQRTLEDIAVDMANVLLDAEKKEKEAQL
jgi:nucleoside-diphosphate-sugar epimerase